MTLQHVLGLYNYWIVIFLMMTGFYIVIASKNLIKAIIGLNVFQTSVFLLYITMGKVHDGTAPIIPPALTDSHAAHEHVVAGHAASHAAETNAVPATELAETLLEDLVEHADHLTSEAIIYSHPLPSVLMLTAIVVGIATTALALALIVRIREEYGTIEEDEILALDRKG